MYYGDQLQEHSQGPIQEDTGNHFSDTLNQILLPVTLIFIYIIASMAINLLKTEYHLNKIIEVWEKTDKSKLIIQIQTMVHFETSTKSPWIVNNSN